MKNYKDIVNHFENIETVMIEADELTLRVTGYIEDKSFMNGFDTLTVKYDHKEVAKEVRRKVSYFII